MPQPAVRAILTRYSGYRFRSRLEARYAVFLDALGVRWEYEPEGFSLPSGWYLPDFYLPEVRGGSWLEIKPHGVGTRGWSKVRGSGYPPRYADEHLFAEFTELVSVNFFVAAGLPDPYQLKGYDYDSPGLLEANWDPHMWCVCGCGATVGIEFDGRGARIDCECNKQSDSDKDYSWDHPIIYEAALAARSARFEYGESGAG